MLPAPLASFARLACLVLAVLPAAASPGLRKGSVPASPDWARCGLPGKGPQTRRIVHGADSEACKWRWQVSIGSPNTGQFCGGTLVAPDWVLTAAHCIRHARHPCSVRNLRVGAGTSQRNTSNAKGAFAERHVTRIFVHPMHNVNVQHDYDFAMLQLDRPMPMNECIGVACLPSSSSKVGTQCHITGWGILSSKGAAPDNLQEASVNLLNMEDQRLENKGVFAYLYLLDFKSFIRQRQNIKPSAQALPKDNQALALRSDSEEALIIPHGDSRHNPGKS